MPDEPQVHSSPPSRRRTRKRLLLSLSGFFLLIGLVWFFYWFFVGQYYESTDDAYVNGNLIQVMPQIRGQVVEILADETDYVEKGRPLVRLNAIDAKIALNNAEAQLALVVRQVSEFYERVNQLQARVREQKNNLEKAQNDYQRRLKLGINISKEDLEHAKLSLQGATAALDLATHERDAAISLVSNSDLYHHPQIQQAAIQVRNAYLNWQRTIIYAPQSGYVAKRPVQVGSEVGPTTILMILVPLKQVWVDANFKESQLRHFRLGQPAVLVSDIYGAEVEYHGKVVGLNPGAGNSFALLPPQNATGNWIKVVQRLPVRIVIDDGELTKHPLRLGLSMTVTVDTHERQGQALASLQPGKIIYHSQDYSARYQKQADAIITQILETNAPNISYHPEE